MSSKSVLVLGIVFIFLLNVVAVHNYIDSYYYKQPDEIVQKQDDSFLSKFFKKVKDTIENNQTKIKPETTKDENKSNKAKQVKLITKKENKKVKEEIKEKEKDILKDLLVEEKPVKQKTKIIKSEDNTTKKYIAKKENKKVKEIDDLDKNAYIILNLNVNDEYQEGNPIIKKMVKRLDNQKVIKIKIYKYNMRVKEYLEDIKSELVDYGVDVDDIKVIYKKNENKKDKIKILLSKKD